MFKILNQSPSNNHAGGYTNAIIMVVNINIALSETGTTIVAGDITKYFPPRVLPTVSNTLNVKMIIVMNQAPSLVIEGNPVPLKNTAGNIINVKKNTKNTEIALGNICFNTSIIVSSENEASSVGAEEASSRRVFILAEPSKSNMLLSASYP